ncbi:homocysteine S-methyltransferase family protein [Photobacterium chitinilyticum]|uniref:Homocysteine S-methyltransferase family protein n=1 Tax=Photobacterium chitinilyticum TaxID=2485123 RepID=A0A444JSX2_9GAMM|nr:homocysteine S-methyltransferase family protein [Photobacterium chitinilyticum]RWX56156.1 homocysteine S-methyltransferase family protein [Photobacterium chitinilyticum]
MKKLSILDGGMGRELKRIGAPFSQPLWSAQALIESPDHIRKAHQNFIDSGAEIIIANSYACVPFHLGDELYRTDGALLARRAAIIAQSVAQDEHTNRNNPVHVAGAMPPAFGSYRPDLFKADEAKKIFTVLFDAQEPHVDLWIAETISSLQEFEVIHSVLKNSSKDRYYSFSLQDDTENDATLRSGQPVSIATALVCFAGGKGILFNCSVPEVMEQAIKDAKAVIEQYGVDVEIGVYANNFTPIQPDHQANDTLQSMRELSPEDYLVFAKRWYELGATIIGGCCGIGPDHIQAIAEWRDTLEES